MREFYLPLEAGLPNIEGAVSSRGCISWQSPTGAFYQNAANNAVEGTGSYEVSGMTTLGMRASKYNPIYGNSSTVQPPAIQLIPQIKY